MERYDSYKDSGVKWLGEIPSHWEVIKNKYLFRESDERNVSGLYKLLSFSKRKGIIPFEENSDKESSSENLRSYKVLHIGQLLENRLQAWNGMFLSSNMEGCVSPDYSVFDILPEGANIHYFSYLFRTNLYIEQWANASKGIGSGFNRLYTPQFGNVISIFPPCNEQDTIVHYLDATTSKIDEAIAQQQKMIDLLNERKQIIINSAVTRGLDPNVKMKDSGVEWIGEVPEHWEVMRMRYLCSITTGNKDTINRVDDGLYPFYVRSPKVERINTYSYDGEAVLMAGDGVGAGKVFHYVNGKFDYHQRVYNFYNIKKIKAKLLYYYMKSHFRYVIEQLSAKSTVDSVRLNMIQDFMVVIPSMQEQLDLIEYLDSQMKNLDDSISTFENQIFLLQERKQIIINDVVTGKVKVS